MGAFISSNRSKNLSASLGGHFNNTMVEDSHQEIVHASIRWLPVRKIRLSGTVVFENRLYHQQYVTTIPTPAEDLYLVGAIDQQSLSFTFRGELFLTPELSLQYYGSPFYSVGSYDQFKRVIDARHREIGSRFEDLDVNYLDPENQYEFTHNGTDRFFANPDFSFMQFRSNLVFRWEYNLGSTLYLVWAHDRSGFNTLYNPIADITGDLFGIKGNHVLMVKLNFWFSV